MTVMQHLDDLVREFLLFRGFGQTLKAFEVDTKAEKEKGFRVDRIIDLMMQHISTYDLASLRDLWAHLHQRVFARLEQHQLAAVAKLESSVLKLYVVNCIQTKRPDKAKEFFDKTVGDLQGQSEWKDWFALPFLTNPETNPTFAGFFSRQWQDTLMLSLFNLLSLIFSCLPPPRLAEFHSTTTKLRRLREENESLRQKLSTLDVAFRQRKGLGLDDIICPESIDPPEDLMDDFYIIAQEAPTMDSQTKTLKAFLRNITGGGGSSSFSQVGPIEKKVTALTSSSSGKQLSSSLRQSRSSSKSRLSTAAATATTTMCSSTSAATSTQECSSSQSIPQNIPHTPVTRLSLSKSFHLQSLPISSSLKTSGDVGGGGTDKMAYLLLGQEEYLEHHSEVTQCRFSSSGFVIASSDVSGVIKVWTATPAAPQTQATFISQQGVTALDWVPNSERHFLYGTRSGTIRLCDKVERRTTSEVICNGIVQTVACSQNGSTFAASISGNKESLLVYDLKSMSCENDLLLSTPTPPLLTSCAFNHNSQMLIAAGVDGKVRVFDLRKRDCISSWSVAVNTSEPILSLALSGDETCVFALTNGGDFSCWSLYQTGQKVFQHRLDDPYFDPVVYPRSAWGRPMAFAGDGRHLLTCSTSGGVIYEFGGSGIGKVEKVLGLKGHREHATCTDWSSANDCGPCVTAARDGQIRISTLLSQ